MLPRSLRRPRPLGAVAAALLIALSTNAVSAQAAEPYAAETPAQSPVPASTGGDVAWSVMPVITDVGEERSNFAYAVDPGTTVEDAVLVRNSGGAVLTLAVHGSDAVTDESGALDVATTAPEADAVGGWIRPDVEKLQIDPGEVVRVPFSVSVPQDAQPGEHAGALLTVLESAGETVSVDMRYATRVTVTVAGELTAGLALDDADLTVSTGFWPWDPASAKVSYTVRNTGNTRLSAMQLVTAPGVELYSSPDAATGFAPLTELLPAAVVGVNAVVEGLSAWMPLTGLQVSVSPTVLTTATDGAPTIGQQQLTLSALAIAPGWWLLLAGAVVLALLVVRFALRRRIRSARTPR